MAALLSEPPPGSRAFPRSYRCILIGFHSVHEHRRYHSKRICRTTHGKCMGNNNCPSPLNQLLYSFWVVPSTLALSTSPRAAAGGSLEPGSPASNPSPSPVRYSTSPPAPAHWLRALRGPRGAQRSPAPCHPPLPTAQPRGCLRAASLPSLAPRSPLRGARVPPSPLRLLRGPGRSQAASEAAPGEAAGPCGGAQGAGGGRGAWVPPCITASAASRSAWSGRPPPPHTARR